MPPVIRSALSPSLLAVALLAVSASGPVVAQAAPLPSMAELPAALAPGKQVLVARQLGLTSAEEADFWPVYDNYQTAVRELREKRMQLVAEIAAADAKRLDQIAQELVQIEIDEADLQKQVRSRLRNRVEAGKLVRYLLLEQMVSALERNAAY
ncbi:hypothetical protein P873_11635 [Arenimonas composti TR7-09 = DSM 18010]|uniref:Uncharacterized protein n=1 Tax=Arenimonas composti TR7-09 = DSM 18010 TaxID=1121013 RepID=A0A091BY63_9GAMM|nr:hypothetical protein P873_11635 [Arenimonas composti TR7-09 = DSM 18010]